MTSSASTPRRQLAALVLAGRRGPDDPLAAATGAKHRALLDVQGVTTLQRVLDTLGASRRFEQMIVSIDQPSLLQDLPELGRRLGNASLRIIESKSSPSRSVLAGLSEFAPDQAVLVTTADHALLDVEMLDEFFAGAETSGADLTLAMVPARRIRARFPDSKRTYLRLRGESYSGANLFFFRTPASRRAGEFWIRAEQYRKQPWRLVGFFGLGSLLLFALRRLDLASAMRRASKAIGARVHAVEMSNPEAAIDVDSLADLELANRIIRERTRSSKV